MYRIAVAVMGTSLSDTHLIKLKRIAKEIIICCDGDDAGWEAAKRFAGMALKKAWMCKLRFYRAEWILMIILQEFGGEAFREKIIGNPHSYMSFIMAYSKRSKNLSYENDVLQFVHEVLEELTMRTSPVERDMYIRQLSNETGISVEAIHQQFMKMAGKQAKQTKAATYKTRYF